MSPRNVAIIAVLIAAAIGSWYVSRTYSRSGIDAAPTETPHHGYYLKSARILGTGGDGSPLYEIRAERAEQQADDRIAFTGVHVRYSPDSDIPWTVDADTAMIYPNEERVLLRGHVRAFSSQGLSGNDTEIRTQYLELDPANYVAETDARVQIRIGARSLTATGMAASLRDNRLELKSNVSGKFVP